MPRYKPSNGDPGHMILGRGEKSYILTILLPSPGGGNPGALLIVEALANSMIEAVAMVEEISVGEVVACLKMYV